MTSPPGFACCRPRDGLGLSEDQITERARNIVTGLMGNYHIEILDDVQPRPSLNASSRTADEDDLLDAPAASES